MYIKIKKVKSQDENCCLLPKGIFNSLNLLQDRNYRLHLGQLWVISQFKPDKDDSNKSIIYVPESIFNKLLLFSFVELNIWKKNEDIYLGPVIGVFVNPRYLSSIQEENPPLSAIKHIQANEEGHCLIYYFTIDKINWINQTIKGYVFTPKWNKWKYYWLPVPNVIYDRGINFKPEEKLLVKHIRKQFHYHPKIHFINNRDYLSKWHLYRHLVKHDKIKELLPETIRYESFDNVKEMLDKHGFIFLKSFYGSRGREVVSINKVNCKYKVTFYKNSLKQKSFDSIAKFKKFCEGFIDNKSFIIQQGIHLAKYKNSVFDLRVLIEKNEYGQWEAIYNQARIAKKDFTITNLSAGGDILNYEDIYSYETKSSKECLLPTDYEIREKAIEIAEYIEKEYGEFGELGMDLAVDTHGNIWFFEANTKPDKNPEPGLEDTEGISPQFLSILRYSKFLTTKELLE